MHMIVSADGTIRSAGPTIMRMGVEPGESRIFELFEPIQNRMPAPQRDPLLALADGKRIFLRQRGGARLTLRGHGAPMPGSDGDILFNFGFGIALPDAVRELGMTEADTVPSDLAMELLFLHEANAAVRAELTRSNQSLEEARIMAERQAFTDPLTGLYNRRGFEVALSLLARQGDTPGSRIPEFAIAHLDLDRFKAVNDQGGHLVGDAVLCAVAEILRGQVRSRDTVARVGGDEFVILLAENLDDETLIRLGRRMISRIEQPIRVAGEEWRISASIGVARPASADRCSYDELIQRADQALYAAKRGGRGKVELFS